MHHHTENEEGLSICESLPRLDLVSFLVLNRIKPRPSVIRFMFQTCDHTPRRQNTDSQLDPSWFGLRPFPCVKGSYLRLDFSP